jgi:NADH-quinone oxidoreductase subunit N
MIFEWSLSFLYPVQSFCREKECNSFINFYIILFAVASVGGFIPGPEGELFGGMYVTSGLHAVMKNILSVGTFIVLILSYTWLQREENKDKISEYFIILLSTLAGMYFMISAGDFLMFYLGMDLPQFRGHLAAMDKMKRTGRSGYKIYFN